jgi:isopentenyl phosphate kinase
MMQRLVYLKLGGSLITDKNRPHTPRPDVLERLAGEICEALAQDTNLRILLGHGSGSFGHVPASKYNTRQGVHTAEEWQGFVEVWREASELTHIVLQAFAKAGLPVMAFPPSSMVITQQGRVMNWNRAPLQQAISRGLMPIIRGDVVFDAALGGTILSTEEAFAHLARHILPAQILLAGIEPGVWADFPVSSRLISEITPESMPEIDKGLKGSSSMDVTGGMAEKVRQVIAMVRVVPGVRASIFSGEVPGNLLRALLGEPMGTQVHG